MPSYCTSCFRDLPSEGAQCRSCSAAAATSLSPSSLMLGALVFAIVIVGMLTLDARLCIAGAAIGVIALVVHLVRSR